MSSTDGLEGIAGNDMIVASGQHQAHLVWPAPQPSMQPSTWPIRACEECKRKKTKCDMGRPTCSLCARVGSECIFPTKRKRPEPRRYSSNKKEKRHSRRNSDLTSDQMIERLMQYISSNRPAVGSGGHVSSVSAWSRGLERSPPDLDVQTTMPLGEEGEAVEPSASHLRMLQARAGNPSNIQTFPPDPSASLPESWEFQDGFAAFLESEPFLSQDMPSNQVSPFANGPLAATARAEDHHCPDSLGYSASGTDSTSSMQSVSPSVQISDGCGPKLYSLTIPDEQVHHLVDVFFSKVSSFVPIFHRPRFYAQYVLQNSPEERFQQLSLESALVLNGILSLSARFSTSAYWATIAPTERGESFAKQAQAVFVDATSQEDRAPTMAYLHGCVLLAFYHHTNSPSSFGWMLSGVCTRLAYDLGINSVDEDLVSHGDSNHPQWSSAENWVEREEMRRAWWSVWELDTFPSTMSRRPYAIDRNMMQVLLPASDERWFAADPVASAFMGSTPVTAWKSLQGSTNQSERAWFLVANFLMALASDLLEQKRVSQQAKEEMESVLSCFALNMPEQFRVSSRPVIFNDETFRTSNWIVATNIMLNVARTYAALIFSPSEDNDCSVSGTTNSDMYAEDRRVAAAKCIQNENDSVRLIRSWSPDYIAYTSPFIACSLLGPASMHFPERKPICKKLQITHVDRELVVLAIQQFAKYWNIGSLLLDIAQTINKFNTDSACVLTAREKELAVRYATIMPGMENRSRSRSVTTC